MLLCKAQEVLNFFVCLLILVGSTFKNGVQVRMILSLYVISLFPHN